MPGDRMIARRWRLRATRNVAFRAMRGKPIGVEELKRIAVGSTL
jgi:hypothetical protein